MSPSCSKFAAARNVQAPTGVPDAFMDPPEPCVWSADFGPSECGPGGTQQKAPDIEALLRGAAAAGWALNDGRIAQQHSPFPPSAAITPNGSHQQQYQRVRGRGTLNDRLFDRLYRAPPQLRPLVQSSSAPRSRQWSATNHFEAAAYSKLHHLFSVMDKKRTAQQQQQQQQQSPFQLKSRGVFEQGSSPLSLSQPLQARRAVARQQQQQQQQHFSDVQSALRAAGITRVIRSAASSPLRGSGGIGWFFQAARAHEALTGDDLGAIPPPASSPDVNNRERGCGGVIISPLSGGGASPGLISPAASLLSPDVQRSVVHLPNGWTMTQLEDLTDDPALFDRVELARRRSNPTYRARTADLHDLHIVMPIVVPTGTLVVEDVLGANYYRFSPSQHGAHLLFGRGVSESSKRRGGNTTASSPGSRPAGQQSVLSGAAVSQTTSPPPPNAHLEFADQSAGGDDVAAPSDTAASVCDVWASFLHLRLGTIYNLSPAQVGFVSDMFRSTTFDNDLCHFYVPIAIDCRGVYPSKDDLRTQRSSRQSDSRQAKSAGGTSRFAARERYETHGVPASSNDLARLQMLRRHVLKFAKRLIEQYNFNSTVWEKTVLPQQQHLPPKRLNCPMPRIELHDNLKARTLLRGSLNIVVREWSPLTDASMFRQVWAKQYSDETESRNAFSAEVLCRLLHHKSIPTARVVTGELRLEHSHLRMVDPRWPGDLVPGRRIADHCADSEVPGPEDSLGRFVFCRTAPLPRVEYTYSGHAAPQEVAVASKLAALYRAHLAHHPAAGTRVPSAGTRVPSASARVPSAVAAATAPSSPSNKSPSIEEAEAKPSNEHTTTGAASSADYSAHFASSAAATTTTSTTMTTTSTGAAARPASNAAAFSLKSPRATSETGILKHLQSTAPTTASLAMQKRCDYSALLEAESPFKRPTDQQLCRFYLAPSGCARGFACKFWHPADKGLESQLDVRQVVPNHPKFF